MGVTLTKDDILKKLEAQGLRPLAPRAVGHAEDLAIRIRSGRRGKPVIVRGYSSPFHPFWMMRHRRWLGEPGE